MIAFIVTSNYWIDERVANDDDGLDVRLKTFRWSHILNFKYETKKDFTRNIEIDFILLISKEEIRNDLLNEIGHESSFLGYFMKTNIRNKIWYQKTWLYLQMNRKLAMK